jgi:uncharacterized membrane protein
MTITILLALATINAYPANIPQQEMKYFTDFGATNGHNIFAFLLATIGAILMWKTKKYQTYTLSTILIIASFYNTQFLTYANAIISITAGTTLATLSQKKWELHYLRNASLLVLFCGLLFGGIAHAVQLSELAPTNEFFKALDIKPATILSHQKYGFWIEHAGHKAIIDDLIQKTKDSEDIEWDTASIFTSTELEKTTKLLNKYNITHILITKEMKQGLLWETEEQGLDFVLKNSETFKTAKKAKNIEIWRQR